jgi:hypothetical protein
VEGGTRQQPPGSIWARAGCAAPGHRRVTPRISTWYVRAVGAGWWARSRLAARRRSRRPARRRSAPGVSAANGLGSPATISMAAIGSRTSTASATALTRPSPTAGVPTSNAPMTAPPATSTVQSVALQRDQPARRGPGRLPALASTPRPSAASRPGPPARRRTPPARSARPGCRQKRDAQAGSPCGSRRCPTVRPLPRRGGGPDHGRWGSRLEACDALPAFVAMGPCWYRDW